MFVFHKLFWFLGSGSAFRIQQRKLSGLDISTEITLRHLLFLRRRHMMLWTRCRTAYSGRTRTPESASGLIKVYEYDVCKLYRGAIVCISFNKRDAIGVIISQGQLAIVVRLPAKGATYNKQHLTLRLAEPGKRIGDVDIKHIHATWKEVTVDGHRTTPPVIFTMI